MIKALIFDFDGVIIESAGIKTDAFRKMFGSDHPEKADAVVDYHKRNMGISRFVKFRHIYENILKLPLTAEKESELGKTFSGIVLEEIVKAPFVNGLEEFMAGSRGRYMMFIASGTPERELHDILKLRGIDTYFKEAYGTPASKPDIIKTILQRYYLDKEEVVFVGDAESDLRASEESGVYFVARIGADSDENVRICKRKIYDLTELNDVIIDIAGN